MIAMVRVENFALRHIILRHYKFVCEKSYPHCKNIFLLHKIVTPQKYFLVKAARCRTISAKNEIFATFVRVLGLKISNLVLPQHPVVGFCGMAWVIVGLGNPGAEYEKSRHNAGRMMLQHFAKVKNFNPWHEEKKMHATVASGMIDKTVVALVLPDTFMNKSGPAVAKYVKNPKAAERMIVVYDDLDLPLGTMKLSFDRGSGGHKGLESVMNYVHTQKFTRIRLGVSPSTAAGSIRKPDGKKAVNDFILNKFSAAQADQLKRVFKKASEALEAIVKDGPMMAMNQFN